MTNQKVLIVDDGKVIRMQVRDMLPKETFEVLEAKDGVEGLNLIREQRPSLILLDFFMPRMNGWEVLAQMQAHPELQTIPLVVMSGRKEEVEEKVPELFDYFEFIEKPFEQKALMGAVRSAIAKARTRQQSVVIRAKAIAPEPEETIGEEEMQELKAEIKALNEKNAKMQAELDALKKQMSQLVAVIKQKLS
jgi:CheY-like chemotaxis protein